jgi:hypothetical protein
VENSISNPTNGQPAPAPAKDPFLLDADTQQAKDERKTAEAVANEITSILTKDPAVASKVFSNCRTHHMDELATLRRGASVGEISLMQQLDKDAANALAVVSKAIETATSEANAQALAAFFAEICERQIAIDKNERDAAKLMNNGVVYAHEIGVRLRLAKEKLVPEGQFEKWVEATFRGIFALSTARLYMRIAEPENWKKISAKVYSPSGLSLREARALLTEKPEKPPKPEPEQRRDERERDALKRFNEVMREWPDDMLDAITGSVVCWFWEALDKDARQRFDLHERRLKAARLRAKMQAEKREPFSRADLPASDFHVMPGKELLEHDFEDKVIIGYELLEHDFEDKVIPEEELAKSDFRN